MAEVLHDRRHSGVFAALPALGADPFEPAGMAEGAADPDPGSEPHGDEDERNVFYGVWDRKA